MYTLVLGSETDLQGNKKYDLQVLYFHLIETIKIILHENCMRIHVINN